MENIQTLVESEVVVELTPLEKLRAELATKKAKASDEAKERLETVSIQASIELLDNPAYSDYLTRREYRDENIKKLTGTVALINAVAPVKIPGEGDAKVNCYPINDRLFGTELALLLGILQTAQLTNIVEQKENILAIINVPVTLVEDAMAAFGTTAYWSKRTFNKYDEIKGDYMSARILLAEVAEKMNLKPLDLSKFSQQAYEQHFAQARTKADAKFKEFQVTLATDANSEFTLTTPAE